jgi:hypothetical protein
MAAGDVHPHRRQIVTGRLVMILCQRKRRIAVSLLVAISIGSAHIAAENSQASEEPDIASRLKTETNRSGPVVPGTTQRAMPTEPTASPSEIAAWIKELDDNRYLARERASQRLLESGSAALDPLLATANGERLEPADRAIWILRRLSKGKDRSLRRQALERLTKLQNRPQIVAAARESLVALRHHESLEAIQALGGRYRETAMVIGTFALPRIILDDEWQGGDDGLVHLEGLAALGTVAVIGTDITVDGLAQLQNVAGLQDLVLYGTKLEPVDVDNLQKRLPQVRIDYRRGALLGVASNTMDGMGPAVVASVQSGSAAEAAGIKAGDIIQRFEKEPVPSFQKLTLMIGEHRAGDEVTLEVLRAGQPIEFTLKLGAWQTFD